MEGLRTESDSQLSFFNRNGTKSCLFVTTQKNLLSFLSSGMITPSTSQFRYRPDTREISSGAIPFWKGGLPTSKDWDARVSDKRTVVLEFSHEQIDTYAKKSTIFESDCLVVVNAPIPIYLASSIYMCSQEAIEDFILRVPDDVVYNDSLFRSQRVFSEVTYQNISELDVTNISSQLEAIDSFAGGVRGVSKLPGEAGLELMDIMSAILAFLDVISPSNVQWSGAEVTVSSSDQLLLTALMPLLKEHKEENGFDPMSFLDGLEFNIRDNIESMPDELVTWFFYVRALVNAEKEVKPLSDDGDIVQRAVLLFILRPSLERLITARESSVAPGHKVLTMAFFFAGCATGITRMSAVFKGEFYSHAYYVKSVLDSMWNKSIFDARLIKSSAEERITTTCFELNGEVLIESESRQDHVLLRVLNQARSLGFEINYDFENDELICEIDIDGKDQQLIYIERMKSKDFEGLSVVRFTSVCLHLPASKMKSLKKAQLLDLLFKNECSEIFCLYALSKKRKALVVEATQIVNAINDNELVKILHHVSNVAAMYE